MANDEQEILGKWTVRVKDWIWEYEFSPGGRMTWRDTRGPEKGVGRWSLGATTISMSWTDSPTTESWTRPITPSNQGGSYDSPYYKGGYKMQKISGPAAGAGGGSTFNVPFERFVDMFTNVKYDLNFKIPPDKSFAFSSILQLTYGDGVSIELDIENDFSIAPMSSDEARNALAKATVGRGGRIFPTVLNARTTPNLWAVREEALGEQDEEAGVFMGIAITATALVLTVPATPAAGAMGGPPGSSPKVTRQTVPGTKVPPAPIQGNQVKFGLGNTPGSLWGSIQKTATEVIYRVDMIILQGRGVGVATARATHREMIKRAAQTAQAAGLKQFKMFGSNANPNFVRHADQLAKEIGVPGSGVASALGRGGHPDYTVILDVAKALAQ